LEKKKKKKKEGAKQKLLDGRKKVTKEIAPAYPEGERKKERTRTEVALHKNRKGTPSTP